MPCARWSGPFRTRHSHNSELPDAAQEVVQPGGPEDHMLHILPGTLGARLSPPRPQEAAGRPAQAPGRGSHERRVGLGGARLGRARRAGVSGETCCEEVSGEAGRTTSSAASQSSEWRGPPGAAWGLLVTAWGFLLGLLWPPGPHLGLPEASWGSQGGVSTMWPSGPPQNGEATRAGNIN